MASPSNLGAVVSVRDSVVDIRLKTDLPPIYSLLRGKVREITMQALTELDANRISDRLASHVWCQDRNGFTHSDPDFRPLRQQEGGG
jgi:hypothetical protein